MRTELSDTTRFLGTLTTASTRSVADLARSRVRTQARRPDPGTAEVTDYHPFLPAALDDPYPLYARLLAGGPVHYNPEQDSWIISRYDHVRAALRADDALSSAEGVARFRSELPLLISMDRPDHTALRRLVADDFTRAGLDRWQPGINTICDALVAAIVGRGQAEVVDDLAAPLPTEVIARMLGIPTADRARFRRWSNSSIQAFNLNVSARSLIPFARSMVSTVRLRGYFRAQIAGRRHEPGDDLLGRLVRSARFGGLSDEQVFWFAFLLLIAGNETTTNLISGMVHTLARDPDLHQRLRHQPELIPAAVEEQLRLHPPVQGFYRTALRDYQVDSCTIPAGARVLVLYAAANHDPRRYPNPDVFRLDRNPTDHLAFGSGVHFCIGAYLSKLETYRVLHQLVRHVSNIELTGPPTWSRNPLLRGLTRLPIRLSAA